MTRPTGLVLMLLRGPWWRAVVVGHLVLAVTVAAPSVDAQLLEAVRAGDQGSVRALIEEGSDVNAGEADGTTPLHWAAYHSNLAIAELLVAAGADATAANRYGVSPISLAAVGGVAAIIELLLEAGADPNTVQGEGETVLMTAVRTGKLEAVEVLLDHGADVNAIEQWRGQTALMWAAAEGHAGIIPTLIAHDADIRARSLGGYSALLFAAREGHIDVVETLLDAGGDLNERAAVWAGAAGRRRDGRAGGGDRHQHLSDCGGECTLRVGRTAPRSRRRSKPRPPRMDGPASALLGPQGRNRR